MFIRFQTFLCDTFMSFSLSLATVFKHVCAGCWSFSGPRWPVFAEEPLRFS